MRAWLEKFGKQSRTFATRYPWIFPIIAILLIYWQLPLTYFQQDEWQAFETYINTGNKPITDCVSIQRPLTCVINNIQWHLLGTNAVAYGIFSLLLTIAVALAFYRLLLKFRLPVYKAALAASLFPLFVTGSQAITWFGAFSATLPNFLFAILAIDFLIEAIRRKSWAWQAASVISVLISLYFKEESLWIIPVMLVTWWAFAVTDAKKQSRQEKIKSFFRYLGPLAVMVLVYLFFERTRQLNSAAFSTLVSTTDSSQYLVDVIKALFLLPFSHLSQILFGPEHVIAFSEYFGLTIEEFSTYTSAMLLVFFAGLLFSNRENYRPSIFVLVVWALTGFIAYAVFGKNPDFLEGRYYFAAQAPVVALLVIGLLPDKVTGFRSFNTASVALLILLVGLNLTLAGHRMESSLAIAEERKNILNYIQERTGPLPKRAIIYTETTNYGYVGQAAAILPFQNGLGTTLRVLYQGNAQDYRAVSKKQGYLWNLLNQGYDEVDGTGFGYFREYDKLYEAYKEHKLSPDEIFAFRYTGKDISDVTSLMRGRLALSDKELVTLPRDGWKVTTNNDKGVDANHGVEKITDADPKSDWAVPHQYGAYLEVDFGRPIDNVAEVLLYTADGNSFPRIFRFEYSSDGETWREDFTDIGTIVDTNKTPILFGPKTIRKLRVKIVDKRDTIFAWSVSDLQIFRVK